MNSGTFRTWLLVLLALAAAACGSGSGNGGGALDPSDPGGDPDDPILGINGGGRWLAQGALSTFGSIVVAGVRYDTNTATIIVNGQPASQADLAQGQVLAAVGEVEAGGLTGTADLVVYENSLRGRIQEIDVKARILQILGQGVQAGVDTMYGASIPAKLDSLLAGDAIVISGFVDSQGRFVATRIDRDPAPGTAEIRGVVSSVDPATHRLNINALVVDYASALLEGFPAGEPVAGDTVLVRGPDPAPGQPLAAALLTWRAGGVDAGADDNVLLEGLVTGFRSLMDFDVAGQRVLTGDDTFFVDSSAARLRLDAFVSVEGQLDDQHRLQAVRVDVLPRADTEIEAAIDGVDLAAGTIRLLGIDVHTNARTRYEDDDDQPISLDQLRAGDGVEIAGYYRDGRFVAVRVERDDEGDDEVEIEGPVNAVNAPEFRIADIRVFTDAQTEFELDDESISADEFFALALGRVAEVEGRWDGTVVIAEEVELDD